MSDILGPITTKTVTASKEQEQAAVIMRDKYKYIGPVYDFLSNLYSGKNIHRCKTAMLDVETVHPGDRILFAGVGHGRDAIRAAELGAEVAVRAQVREGTHLSRLAHR